LLLHVGPVSRTAATPPYPTRRRRPLSALAGWTPSPFLLPATKPDQAPSFCCFSPCLPSSRPLKTEPPPHPSHRKFAVIFLIHPNSFGLLLPCLLP
jgi:hypothetical protein